MLALLGCASAQQRGRYSTVPATASRNTSGAQDANQLGLRAIDKDDYAEAEEHFRTALKCDSFYAPAHNNLGLVLLNRGQVYEAAWEFEFASRILPEAAEPRNNLGILMERVGELDQAITHYQEALKLDPQNIEVMAHLANAYLKSNPHENELRELLNRLTVQNSNPHWGHWAQQQLTQLEAPNDPAPSH